MHPDCFWGLSELSNRQPCPNLCQWSSLGKEMKQQLILQNPSAQLCDPSNFLHRWEPMLKFLRLKADIRSIILVSSICPFLFSLPPLPLPDVLWRSPILRSDRRRLLHGIMSPVSRLFFSENRKWYPAIWFGCSAWYIEHIARQKPYHRISFCLRDETMFPWWQREQTKCSKI